MDVSTIKNLFSGIDLTKRIVLCVEVKAQNNAKNFQVQDKNGDTLELDLSSEKEQLVKMVEVGRKIRIIFPKIDLKNRKIVIVNKTKIYQVAVKSGKYTH